MEMDEPDLCHIAVSVNGVEWSLAVAADETLLDVLRDRLRSEEHTSELQSQ